MARKPATLKDLQEIENSSANGHVNGAANGTPIKPYPGPGISDSALLKKEIAPPREIVKGLFAEGLQVFVGSPKCFKSWFALAAAECVAAGSEVLGRFDTIQGDVMYLALEDGDGRLKSRLELMLGPDARGTGRLFFHTKYVKIDEGLVQHLTTWAQSVPQPRLIIIDTLAMIRATPKPGVKRSSVYEEEYACLEGLRALALQFGMTILIIHHTRKRKKGEDPTTEEFDPFDEVSGTQAITGCADGTMILSRPRNTFKGVLTTTSRDLPEAKIELEFRRDEMRWRFVKFLGERKPAEGLQRMIGDLLISGPLTPAEIAKRLGQNTPKGRSKIKVATWRMGKQGLLVAEDGVYRLATEPEPEEDARHEGDEHTDSAADARSPRGPTIPVPEPKIVNDLRNQLNPSQEVDDAIGEDARLESENGNTLNDFQRRGLTAINGMMDATADLIDATNPEPPRSWREVSVLQMRISQRLAGHLGAKCRLLTAGDIADQLDSLRIKPAEAEEIRGELERLRAIYPEPEAPSKRRKATGAA